MTSSSETRVTKCRQTEDELTRDMLLATASQINCVGGSNGDSPTELTYSDIIGVVRELRTNNAYEFLEGVGGENKFGQMCAEVKSFLIDLELPLAA